ncbi:hypothetical protein HMI54_012516 [Coelomomyces lativittatus]|nr:hypothetical protein HMI55_004556 [Coelomomyces lativittatus]KAJ1514999.1 hypothetical protein HMI56_006915 [Coelomomyces lativittatus]KAJ1515334.1 hypothetical protein HMI54_012516 [Coelomomyces lativittatus]
MSPCKSDDAQFIMTATAKRFPVQSTIQHWQLRDLIVCGTKNGSKEIFYVCGNNVHILNTETGSSVPILKDLSFPPTCITTSHGYLAVGGQRSQLLVRQLTSNWFSHTSVGGCINNALSVINQGGSIRLLVSNNDESIKIYTLPSLVKVSCLSLPTAVNHSSVSPDGSTLAAVGDCNQVFLFNLTPSGGYHKLATIEVKGSSSGFSCAWNAASEKFAISSQDGFVQVYDVRSTHHPLAKFMTFGYPSENGAARVVKFSHQSSVDLLTFSEHMSHIHVVDARTFNERQIVRVAPTHREQHISGLAFSNDAKQLYVGLEDGILGFEVNSKSRRVFPYGDVR